MNTNESDDTGDFGPEQAMNDLGTANRSADRARGQGWRWVRAYLLVWAIASIGLITGLGIGNKAVTIGIFIAWTALSLVAPRWRSTHRPGRRSVGGVLRNRPGCWGDQGDAVGRILDRRSGVHFSTVDRGRAHPRPEGR